MSAMTINEMLTFLEQVNGKDIAVFGNNFIDSKDIPINHRHNKILETKPVVSEICEQYLKANRFNVEYSKAYYDKPFFIAMLKRLQELGKDLSDLDIVRYCLSYSAGFITGYKEVFEELERSKFDQPPEKVERVKNPLFANRTPLEKIYTIEAKQLNRPFDFGRMTGGDYAYWTYVLQNSELFVSKPKTAKPSEPKKELHTHIFKNNAFEVWEYMYNSFDINEHSRSDVKFTFEKMKRDKLIHDTVYQVGFLKWISETYEIEIEKTSMPAYSAKRESIYSEAKQLYKKM